MNHQLLKEDVALTRILIQSRQKLTELIEPCDHAVGICSCSDQNVVREIDQQLVDTFGFNLPWQFYHAQAHNTPHEDKLKWAKIGRDLLFAHIREQFAEIETNEEPVF